MEEEVEERTITVEGEHENLAVFLGHNLTPPLVEATIMVIIWGKKSAWCLTTVSIENLQLSCHLICRAMLGNLLLQVLSDMTLILLSVVGNLFVLNSLREREALLAITQNLVS